MALALSAQINGLAQKKARAAARRVLFSIGVIPSARRARVRGPARGDAARVRRLCGRVAVY